jgi:hypothetical protein
MLWLTGYFDAGGHPDARDVLVVGGYISAIPKWLKFETEWKAALRPHGIDVFHMADFMACAGDYKNWRGREHEQAALLMELARITRLHVRKSFSTMVILDDWRKVNQAYCLKENHCTPYGICGFFTIDKTMRYLARRKEPFAARFVFEDGDKHKGDFMWMMDEFFRINPKRWGGIKPDFQPKSLSPLQAADFVLWEQSKLAKDYMKEPNNPPEVRQSFQELMRIPRNWGVLNEEGLIAFCDDFGISKRGAPKKRWSPVASRRQGHAEGQQ